MDTRRTPGPGSETQLPPDLGRETVPVELVELEPVGGARPSPRSRALLVAGIAAVLAVGAIVATVKPPTPTPSPSAIAAASDPATAVAVVPAVLPPTPRPTSAPQPTTPPPWQWERSEFDADIRLGDAGAWGVNDGVIVLLQQFDPRIDDRHLLTFERFTADGSDDLVAAPPAVDRFWAPSVLGSRLFFFAHVLGVASDQESWQLVSTPDGRSWHSFGPAVGLDALVPAFVSRPGQRWVIGAWPKSSGGVGAPTPEDLMWSVDGVRWQVVELPEHPGIRSFAGNAMLGGRSVILGFDWRDFGDLDYYFLTSDDGRAWRRTPVQIPAQSVPTQLVCGEETCLMTVAVPVGGEGSTTQALYISSDGEHWDEVALEAPLMGSDSGISQLRATSKGFIGTTGLSSPVLLSDDGRSWRAVDVLPPGTPDYFHELAAAGDLVVGLVETSSDVPDAMWRGSLAAMEAAPR